MNKQMDISKQRGFTLIELMVVVSILAVLLVLGIPALKATIANSKVKEATSNLSVAMARARSEAVKLSRPARVCPSSNATSCGGSWTDGWILMADTDGIVPTPPASPIDNLVANWPAADAQVSITLDTAATEVDFAPTGLVIASGGQAGRCFSISANDADYDRYVVVTATGRASTFNGLVDAELAAATAAGCP